MDLFVKIWMTRDTTKRGGTFCRLPSVRVLTSNSMTPRPNTTTISTEFDALPLVGAYEPSYACIECRAFVQHIQAETAFE